MGAAYRCLLIDDEMPAHKVIISHISHFDDLEYAGSAYNGKEALEMLRENEYDIIFLDINMPLVNGVELMQIQQNRPVTIVTTAYSDFALESYQHDAIDYLLKPVSLPLFIKAIEKAKLFCKDKQDKAAKKTTFSFRNNGEEEEVLLKDIACVESTGNYLKLYVNNNRPVVIYGTLSNTISELDSLDFIQVHRSFIINKNFIKNITKDTLLLSNGLVIPVGRKYKILLDSRFTNRG